MCTKLAHFMLETYMFYVWYWRIPCMVLAYSTHGTAVSHAYMYAYIMNGTGISMYTPCIVPYI